MGSDLSTISVLLLLRESCIHVLPTDPSLETSLCGVEHTISACDCRS